MKLHSDDKQLYAAELDTMISNLSPYFLSILGIQFLQSQGAFHG